MDWLDNLTATLKSRLGLDLTYVIDEDRYGAGNTEAGFSSTFVVDMDELNQEIDRFSATLPGKEGWTTCDIPFHQFIRDESIVKPGLVYEFTEPDGSITRNIIGHINELGGYCDCCSYNHSTAKVVRYRQLNWEA